MRRTEILASLTICTYATADTVGTSSGPPENGCVKDAIPNLAAFYGARSQASIQMREIDGAPFKPEGRRSHCVAPGNHQIGCLADNAGAYQGFRVADDLVIAVAASGQHLLRGHFEGINLHLRVLDAGTPTETVLQALTFKISGGRKSPPFTSPVPITGRH